MSQQSGSPHDSIENLSQEDRRFAPSQEFAAQANAKADLYAHADKDRLAFWDEQANELQWDQKWNQTLEWNSPYAKWFLGGKLNASVNALDRHVNEGRGARVAFHFEGEPGDTRTITFYLFTSGFTFAGQNAGGSHTVILDYLPRLETTTITTAADSSTTTIAPGSISRTISFGSTFEAKTYGDSPFTVLATASIGIGDITYTSSNSAVCTVSSVSGEVSIVGTGSCEISAAIPASGTYAPASSLVPVSVIVNKASLTITASSASIASANICSADGTLSSDVGRTSRMFAIVLPTSPGVGRPSSM